MKTQKRLLLFVLLSLAMIHSTRAQGTAFTYQGRLLDNAAPANGAYDLLFYLRDAATSGNPVGPTNNMAPVNVTNGLFTVTLDFGAGVFSGAPRWLEMAVRTNGSATAHTALSPRQNLTPVPYAINAGNLSGPVAESSLPASVPRMNQVWQLGGNPGTTPGTQFLGTTDDQALEFKVNGGRALRLEPKAGDAPNVLAGSSRNEIGAGVSSSVIAGGGSGLLPHFISSDFASIGGGGFNTVFSDYGTIAGGLRNAIYQNAPHSAIGGGAGNIAHSQSRFSVIGGGATNSIAERTDGGVIGGGWMNSVGVNATGSTISGGAGNVVSNYTQYGVIGGGSGNQIREWSHLSVIFGGAGNRVGPTVQQGSILGGSHNLIDSDANESTVGGGYWNRIGTNSHNTSIGGGSINSVSFNSPHSTIAGGGENQISSLARRSVIGGGYQNSLGAESYGATIAGGELNEIQSEARYSALSGGSGNQIQEGATHSFIGGGYQNTVGDSAWGSVIAGGADNSINIDASNSSIGGGSENQIGGILSVIAGGIANRVEFNADWSTISGGAGNVIEEYADSGTISGGWTNTVTGVYGTVPGGTRNLAGEFSLAAGFRAKAAHSGSFVWADETQADFATTEPNQFLIRASGGVNIGGTTSAGALHIAAPLGIPPAGLPAADNGIAMGLYAHSGYKWMQSYGGPLALNPIGHNIGIGTTNPVFLLEVNGSAGKPGGGSWSVASDKRLKKNVQQLAGALDQLLQLRGVSFEYIEPEKIHELSGERVGMLAQEVEKVFPDWVEMGSDGFKRLTVRGFEALTVEALRELRSEKDAKIAALEAQVENLKSAQDQLNDQWEVRLKAVERMVGNKKSEDHEN